MSAVVIRRDSGLRAALTDDDRTGYVYMAASNRWTRGKVKLHGDIVARHDANGVATFNDALRLLADYKRTKRIQARLASL